MVDDSVGLLTLAASVYERRGTAWDFANEARVPRLCLDLLVIEEAHGLPTATLKHLKRFFELEDGFKKLLGIVLIGQTELRMNLLDLHAKALAKGGDLVFDHCAVEWMADWMRWHWAAVSTRAWDAALAKTAKLVAKYDVVAHLTSGPARGYDGYAWLDKPNAAQVEELMFMLYGRFGTKVEKVRG